MSRTWNQGVTCLPSICCSIPRRIVYFKRVRLLRTKYMKIDHPQTCLEGFITIRFKHMKLKNCLRLSKDHVINKKVVNTVVEKRFLSQVQFSSTQPRKFTSSMNLLHQLQAISMIWLFIKELRAMKMLLNNVFLFLQQLS